VHNNYAKGGASIGGLGDSAKRLGIQLDDLTVKDGEGYLRVSFTGGIKHGDIAKIVTHVKSKGATSLVLDTGFVVNPKIAARIERTISSGKPFLGGTPRLVREAPNIIPGGPPVKIFAIVFD
jgi:hypothetical protein